MTDGAITTIVAGVITVTTMVVGFLTLWVKLKYGAEKAEETASKVKVVEGKIDDNTRITARIEKQTNGPLSNRLAQYDAKLAQLDDHNARIGALEVKVEAIKSSLDSLGKNLDSTRHEIRSNLQTITNNLQLLAMKDAVTPASVTAVQKQQP